jgi:hypothetical protein
MCSWETPCVSQQTLAWLAVGLILLIGLFCLATVIADIRRWTVRRRMLKLWRKHGWIR